MKTTVCESSQSGSSHSAELFSEFQHSWKCETGALVEESQPKQVEWMRLQWCTMVVREGNDEGEKV